MKSLVRKFFILQIGQVIMVSQTIQVGKKYAIYLPKKIVEEVGIKEGDVLIVQVRGKELVLKRVEKELKIGKPWAKIRAEEVEEVGEEITRKILG